jgi:hypothetical protein
VWTLGSYGNAEVKGQTVIFNNGSIITCEVNRIGEVFEITFKVNPNISGIGDTPVHIFPRYLQLNNVEALRMLLVDITLEVSQAILVLATLMSMGLPTPKYVNIVINVDREENRYKAVGHKVIANIGAIGYEIAVTGRRRVYRITIPSFELFKAFVDVIVPEFLENRGGVRE